MRGIIICRLVSIECAAQRFKTPVWTSAEMPCHGLMLLSPWRRIIWRLVECSWDGGSMEKYYHALIRYLTVRLRDNHLAADVAHDAYVRVLERGETDAVKHPQAYLYR